MHIYVYIYMYAYTHICKHIYIHKYTHIYLYILMYMYIPPQDLAMQTVRSGKRKAPGTVPSAAFGPRQGDGRENVSVVRSTLRKG